MGHGCRGRGGTGAETGVSWGENREPLSKPWVQASTTSTVDHPRSEKVRVGRVRRRISASEVKSQNWGNIRHRTGHCNIFASQEKRSKAKPWKTLWKRPRGMLASILRYSARQDSIHELAQPRSLGKTHHLGHPALRGLVMVWPQQSLPWEGKVDLKHDSFIETVVLQLRTAGKNIFSTSKSYCYRLTFLTPGFWVSLIFVCLLSGT